MSRSHSNPPVTSEQSQTHCNSHTPPKYPDELPLPPVLTSYETDWSNASLECHRLPAGESPNLCLDHYLIGIGFGQGHPIETKVDGVAQGRLQSQLTLPGAVTLIPMHHCNWARWHEQTEAITLNLKSNLLTRHAAEILAIEQVELLPYVQLHDPLILQIVLALKADLESHKLGGQLYAETMTCALSVHLLRKYSSHTHKSVCYLGGLSYTQLKLVMDYINDHLDQNLSLDELAVIAQISLYHFCHSFKRSTGFTPHQYVIRQRVEKAKLLLKDEKMGIAEVAITCGFTHQSHLNRHFKRLTGVTPKKFSRT